MKEPHSRDSGGAKEPGPGEGAPEGAGAGTGTNGAPHARVELGRAPRWIWLVPIVAAAVVGWLAVRSFLPGQREVVVRFADAHGVRADTAVRFKGVPVGKVRSVDVSLDRRSVEMRITIDGALADLLQSGTRFWVVEPELSGGQLPSVIAGSFVTFMPGEGTPSVEFTGLERAPLVEASEEGRSFLLRTRDAGNLSPGTPLRYRGVRVGRVQGISLDEESGDVSVHLFVPGKQAALIRTGTRFWTASGLTLSTEGGIGVSVPSLGTIVSGGISFDSPELFAGPAAPDGAHFGFHGSRDGAETAMPGPEATYVIDLPGPLDGLSRGAPVEIAGIRVGRVREVRLAFDGERVAMRTPVTIEVDARRLGLEVTTATARAELRARLDAVLGRLCERGLRARVTSGVLPGSAAVSLAMIDDAPAARLDLTSDPPALPAVAPGGLGGALAAAGRDVGPIVQSVRRITERLDEVLRGDELRRSLAHVQGSLASLESVALTASKGAGPIIRDLESAVRSVEQSARKVERLLGGPATQGEGLADLVKELTRGARAVRELAAYVSRHPEAFVTGRKGP